MEDVYIGERVPFLDEVQKITKNGKIILEKVTEYSTAVDDQIKPKRRTKYALDE